ncbi:Complex III subunit 9 [Aphelenchoides fujianensis]|nr:Complex III subunit 9 [Aphelenchoides fujianensis]
MQHRNLEVMGWGAVFYRLVGRRFSTTLLAASAGVFGFDLVVNKATDAYWNSINKGKQWKDIKGIVEARFNEAKEQARLEAVEEAESNVQEQMPEPDANQNKTPSNEGKGE